MPTTHVVKMKSGPPINDKQLVALLDEGKRLEDIYEEDFRRVFEVLATENGWLHYHAMSPYRDAQGFYDEVLMKSEMPTILVELKSETGRLEAKQHLWRDQAEELYSRSLGAVRYRLWRPSNWFEIRLALEKGILGLS